MAAERARPTPSPAKAAPAATEAKTAAARQRWREVDGGVYELRLPLPMPPSAVNVYLVRGGKEWTLIDTGMNTEESTAAFRAACTAVGCEIEAIERIIATHHHPDHFGASAPYRAASGAAVHLHSLEVERLKHMLAAGKENRDFLARHGVPPPPPGFELPSPREFFGTLLAPVEEPEELMNDGDVISLGGGRKLNVVWTPGHTAGHCCLLLEPGGLLFAGDHLLPKITPHVGVWPGGPENPLGDFLASLEKVQRLSATMVLPSHGAPYPDHRRRARQLIQHHHYRKLAMLDRIRARAATAYEVAMAVFDVDRENRFQVTAATCETIAHLELLVREGRALRGERGGVIVWRGR